MDLIHEIWRYIQEASAGSATGQFGKGNILIPSGINMEGSEGMLRAGGIFREGEKSGAHPVDLEPQTIPEALLAARHTAEFRRRTLKYSWDLKTMQGVAPPCMHHAGGRPPACFGDTVTCHASPPSRKVPL